jgi:hypothetical protein
MEKEKNDMSYLIKINKERETKSIVENMYDVA